MSLPTLSGTGRLTADPALRYTNQGVAVCEVRIAFNSRKFNKQSQDWEDGDTCYMKATAWRGLAENIGECLSKGDAVTVSGRVKTEQWQDKATGDNRSATVMDLDSCGPDLTRATAKVHKAERGFRDGSSARPTGTDGIQTGYDAGDPWGSAPPSGQPSEDVAPF